MNEPILPRLRLAVFDFDGTLLACNSYHVFLKSLLRHRELSSIVLAGALCLRKLHLISRPQLMRVALRSLKGMSRSEVEAFGRKLFKSAILPCVRGVGMEEMQRRREAGFRIIILSGAFDFLLQPFCAFSEIADWHCTKLAYEDEICSGWLEGEEFLGDRKRLFLLDAFHASEVDWENSCAYSDELVDLPMFSLVGQRFWIAGSSNDAAALPEGMQKVIW